MFFVLQISNEIKYLVYGYSIVLISTRLLSKHGTLPGATECKRGRGYLSSLECLPLDPESGCWTQARHLPGTQGHCCDLEEGTLSITMLEGICDYHLHFHQRCLVTGDRQVQFSLNQDPARIYFLFLPWAEPVLNNSVSTISKD